MNLQNNSNEDFEHVYDIDFDEIIKIKRGLDWLIGNSNIIDSSCPKEVNKILELNSQLSATITDYLTNKPENRPIILITTEK
jgi:hypothetical protein